MAKPVVITTDSSGDLPEYIRKEFEIHYRPIYIRVEEKEGLDGIDVFPREIYEAFRLRGALPKTAAPSPEEYKDFFEQFTAQGAAVVHVSLNAGFSSCYQFADMAAQEMEGEVYVVDSKNFCTGQGILALRGALLRREGLEAREIARQLTIERSKVRAMYYLHGLEFLSQSGRCPKLVAMGATLLNLHPGVSMKEGEIVVGKKYRGKKAPEAWLRDVCGRFMEECDMSLAFFMHTPEMPPEQYEPMERLAAELLPGVGRMVMDGVGCAIVSHVGGDCYALVGMEK